MESGADVTIRDIELRSVLHAAVGHPSAMEVLLQVNPNKTKSSQGVVLNVYEVFFMS